MRAVGPAVVATEEGPPRVDLGGQAARQAPAYVLDDGETVSLHFEESQIQSRMSRTDPTRLVVAYTRVMFGFFLFCPAPRRLLLIGLGGGSIVKHCRLFMPDVHITAVEIAEDVIALRETFGVPPDGPHLHVVHADGAAFLREPAEYDVILVDGFDAAGQAPSLCSSGFYADCRARLSDRGVLVINLNALSTGYGAYARRVHGLFGEGMVLVPTDDGQNKVLFAWKGPLNLDALRERASTADAWELGLDQLVSPIVAGLRGSGAPG